MRRSLTSASEVCFQVVHFARFKAFIAKIMTARPLGWAIGVLFRNRIPCRGIRINTSVGVSNYVKAQLFLRFYESEEIRSVQRYLDPNLNIIELGASLGVISCHIARRNRTGRFIVVEANPDLSEVIASNLIANVPGREVSIISAAIDYFPNPDKRSRLSFGTSNLDSRIVRQNTLWNATVPCTTLSDLLEKYSIKEYALVCDIEGGEAGILKYDSDALAGCRQIIAEFHDSSIGGCIMLVKDMVECLVKLGYCLRFRRGSVFVFERR